MQTLSQYIKESPDAIVVDYGSENEKDWEIFDYTSPEAITFTIIADTVIYGKKRNLMHFQMDDFILKALEKYKFTNTKDIVDYLQKNKIYVINPNKSVFNKNFLIKKLAEFEENRESGEPTFGVTSGRFFAKGDGYISFWESPDHVKTQMRTVVDMLEHLGYDANKVTWEMYKGEEQDEVLVSFQEFMGNKQKKISKQDKQKEQEFKKKQIAQHLQAGMKRLTGDIQPMKQISADMPNVQYKQLTTIGDAVNQLLKSISTGKSCIMEDYNEILHQI